MSDTSPLIKSCIRDSDVLLFEMASTTSKTFFLFTSPFTRSLGIHSVPNMDPVKAPVSEHKIEVDPPSLALLNSIFPFPKKFHHYPFHTIGSVF